jgi:ribosome-associated heat shock protein Hsp15
MDNDDRTGLRIDRWLFFTRFFKTRSLATKAVTGGHVHINGERVSPGTRVRVGDRLYVTKRQTTFVITVLDIPSRRGPATEARACYVEDEASMMAREEKSRVLRQDRLGMPTTRGRPDKHTRRKLISRNRG